MPKRYGNEVYDAVWRMHTSGKTYDEIAATLSIPKTSVGGIIHRIRYSTGRSKRELDAIHAEKMKPTVPSWQDHVKPLHEHKKRLEAEVAAKAEELRKSREELDSYLATLKELMGGA